MGMVFQQFNLFPHMTVLKNMILGPVKLLEKSKEEATKEAMELLGRVGLADRANALSVTAFGRSKTACGNCPCALYESGGNAF